MENEFIIKQVCILFHLSEKNQYYGFRIENKRWDILKACNFINLNIDEWICKIQNDSLKNTMYIQILKDYNNAVKIVAQ